MNQDGENRLHATEKDPDGVMRSHGITETNTLGGARPKLLTSTPMFTPSKQRYSLGQASSYFFTGTKSTGKKNQKSTLQREDPSPHMPADILDPFSPGDESTTSDNDVNNSGSSDPTGFTASSYVLKTSLIQRSRSITKPSPQPRPLAVASPSMRERTGFTPQSLHKFSQELKDMNGGNRYYSRDKENSRRLSRGFDVNRRLSIPRAFPLDAASHKRRSTSTGPQDEVTEPPSKLARKTPQKIIDPVGDFSETKSQMTPCKHITSADDVAKDVATESGENMNAMLDDILGSGQKSSSSFSSSPLSEISELSPRTLTDETSTDRLSKRDSVSVAGFRLAAPAPTTASISPKRASIFLPTTHEDKSCLAGTGLSHPVNANETPPSGPGLARLSPMVERSSIRSASASNLKRSSTPLSSLSKRSKAILSSPIRVVNPLFSGSPASRTRSAKRRLLESLGHVEGEDSEETESDQSLGPDQKGFAESLSTSSPNSMGGSSDGGNSFEATGDNVGESEAASTEAIDQSSTRESSYEEETRDSFHLQNVFQSPGFKSKGTDVIEEFKNRTTPPPQRSGLQGILSSSKSYLRSGTARKEGRSVVFGSPKVAEYRIGSPSVSMTPLPSRRAKQLFPMETDEFNESTDTEPSNGYDFTAHLDTDMDAMISNLNAPSKKQSDDLPLDKDAWQEGKIDANSDNAEPQGDDQRNRTISQIGTGSMSNPEASDMSIGTAGSYQPDLEEEAAISELSVGRHGCIDNHEADSELVSVSRSLISDQAAKAQPVSEISSIRLINERSSADVGTNDTPCNLPPSSHGAECADEPHTDVNLLSGQSRKQLLSPANDSEEYDESTVLSQERNSSASDISPNLNSIGLGPPNRNHDTMNFEIATRTPSLESSNMSLGGHSTDVHTHKTSSGISSTSSMDGAEQSPQNSSRHSDIPTPRLENTDQICQYPREGRDSEVQSKMFQTLNLSPMSQNSSLHHATHEDNGSIELETGLTEMFDGMLPLNIHENTTLESEGNLVLQASCLKEEMDVDGDSDESQTGSLSRNLSVRDAFDASDEPIELEAGITEMFNDMVPLNAEEKNEMDGGNDGIRLHDDTEKSEKESNTDASVVESIGVSNDSAAEGGILTTTPKNELEDLGVRSSIFPLQPTIQRSIDEISTSHVHSEDTGEVDMHLSAEDSVGLDMIKDRPDLSVSKMISLWTDTSRLVSVQNEFSLDTALIDFERRFHKTIDTPLMSLFCEHLEAQCEDLESRTDKMEFCDDDTDEELIRQIFLLQHKIQEDFSEENDADGELECFLGALGSKAIREWDALFSGTLESFISPCGSVLAELDADITCLHCSEKWEKMVCHYVEKANAFASQLPKSRSRNRYSIDNLAILSDVDDMSSQISDLRHSIRASSEEGVSLHDDHERTNHLISCREKYMIRKPAALKSHKHLMMVNGLTRVRPRLLEKTKFSFDFASEVGSKLSISFDVSSPDQVCSTVSILEKANQNSSVADKFETLSIRQLAQSEAHSTGKPRSLISASIQRMEWHLSRSFLVATELKRLARRYPVEVSSHENDSTGRLSLVVELGRHPTKLKAAFSVDHSYPGCPLDVEFLSDDDTFDFFRARRAFSRTSSGFGSLSRACDAISASL